jgi:O6-methylguanine-DNA--protein-cysteine methyltransferase
VYQSTVSFRGYGGGEGLKTKEWLLKMEGAVIA